MLIQPKQEQEYIAHSGEARYAKCTSSLSIMLEATDLLLGLQIAIAVLAIIVFYHVLFIVVNARKIVARIQDITEQLEEVLLKPISMADQILEFIMQFFQKKYNEAEQKEKLPKKK